MFLKHILNMATTIPISNPITGALKQFFSKWVLESITFYTFIATFILILSYTILTFNSLNAEEYSWMKWMAVIGIYLTFCNLCYFGFSLNVLYDPIIRFIMNTESTINTTGGAITTAYNATKNNI